MIELQDLWKSFPADAGPVPVLRGVSLSVRQGEIFGIIGRSGAGKSTLVRCINLLERPTSGRVSVGGQDVTALRGGALRQARHGIGMIFQHFNLLSSRTALENVALPLELAGTSKAAARAAAAPLLELVGLATKQERYPVELSGGEKQRVGIARALASKPAVLLCDEATSALDPETTRSILALVKDINGKLGLTIVLITHEMQVIQSICDRVAVLDHGEVVEQGPVFDVFTAPRTEVTRSFVRDLVDRELPAGLAARLAAGTPGRGNPVIRIVFTGPSATSPVVAEAVRRHGVLLNILQANIDYIQGLPYGNVLVEAIGGDAEVAAALAFIRGHDLKVEVIGHVAGDARALA
jgi:D-methionine transport system ATP-binding protein